SVSDAGIFASPAFSEINAGKGCHAGNARRFFQTRSDKGTARRQFVAGGSPPYLKEAYFVVLTQIV
ncbi:hypothetical protein ACS8EN_23625, partial [Escherichia coli]|uniref:hypothetical protein n=1 Tax=Escherichia coli TaxID=562 RepID=UPI003F44B363